MAEQPIFVVTLRAEPHVVDAAYMLRGLLKVALRRFGLRCIDVKPAKTPHVADPLDFPSNLLT